MNPLYQQFMMPQRMTAMMQAMQNPAAFVRQQFPDIPAEIANDPNQILRYLQQTRGIPDARIQQLMTQYPMGR